jgi:hypothetical protein
MRRVIGGLLLILTVFFIFPVTTLGLPRPAVSGQPIVILSVDKLDSIELWNTHLPSLKRLLNSGACGLMNIRSSMGYTDSPSGYLTLGAGSRSTVVGTQIGTFELLDALIGGNAASYIDWSFGVTLNPKANQHLAVPEIGLLKNQAHLEDHQTVPGLLGDIFQHHGWRTCLIGNIDSQIQKNRPGGLVIMNKQGLIDEGAIDHSVIQSDPDFPYLYRTNIPAVVKELHSRLGYRKIILLEFGDFARLDLNRDQINIAHYLKLKAATWKRFDRLVKKITELGAPSHFALVVTSPSISKEGLMKKNLLAPLIIYSQDYQKGLLTSGTTKWSGLAANIDLLPTLIHMAHFDNVHPFSGKIMKVTATQAKIPALLSLNERLVMLSFSQPSLLNWYRWLIALGWTIGLFCIYLRKNFIGEWLLTGVCSIPLALIILPLLPVAFWNSIGLSVLTLVLAAAFLQIKDIHLRILIQASLLWLILIGDQILGWQLIRFSALGYNAMSGSRYYGLGNEFLGVFLAVSLLSSYLIYHYTAKRWPAIIILAITLFILSWPQFGAKFGGIIAGVAGFGFYLFHLYHLKLNNRKMWLAILGCGLALLAIGLWDSSRPPEFQTHIGRFVHLFISKDFSQVGEIILRKLMMNLKLSVVSPWSRLILLWMVLAIINRAVTTQKLILRKDQAVWQALLTCGITAYLVNDAGVLAFATCLAYGFSYGLLKKTRYPKDTRDTGDTGGLALTTGHSH